MNRRNFISKIGLATTVGTAFLETGCRPVEIDQFFIATWNNEYAVETAYSTYIKGGSLLDGIENGIRAVEANPDDSSVGYGGRPDREGQVTLDACIMDHKGNAGSVVYLQNIKHPITLARKVMEQTPHVIMAGNGAKQFALENGMKEEDLLTEESEAQWKNWLKEAKYKPIINIENHDTIGMLGFDKGMIVGGCSTSGLAYKMNGRVGDSPIIGAGLFVDNEVGACVATGLGEKVLKTLSAFLVVELMRNGYSPELACKEALQRILKKESGRPDFQVALLAVNKKAEYGAYSIYNNFHYVLASKNKTIRQEAPSYFQS